jgi:hypothetical protein
MDLNCGMEMGPFSFGPLISTEAIINMTDASSAN